MVVLHLLQLPVPARPGWKLPTPQHQRGLDSAPGPQAPVQRWISRSSSISFVTCRDSGWAAAHGDPPSTGCVARDPGTQGAPVPREGQRLGPSPKCPLAGTAHS